MRIMSFIFSIALLFTLSIAQRHTGPNYECSAGKYLFAASDCRPCPAGSFAIGPNNPGPEIDAFAPYPVCSVCPANTYADKEGLSECKLCSNGQYSDIAATFCRNCEGGSNSCADDAAYYTINNPRMCPFKVYTYFHIPGLYQGKMVTLGACQFYPAGYETSKSSTRLKTFFELCAINRYNHAYSDGPCLSCGANVVTCDNTSGVVTKCDDGYITVDNTCTPCGSGTFSQNSLNCTSCSSTSFSGIAAGSCTSCPVGTVASLDTSPCVSPPICRGSTGLRGSAPLAPLAPLAVGAISSSVVAGASISSASTVTIIQAATCSATVSVSVTTFTTTATVTITSLPTATGINSAVNQIQQVFTILISVLNVQTKNAVIGITCPPSNINKSSDLWICEV